MILCRTFPPRPAALALAGALLSGLAAAGCGAERGSTEASAAAEPTLPRPNLEAMEAPARDRILAAIAEIEALPPSAGPSERAAALGALGDLYFAYDLFDAAVTCYRQAVALDPDEPRWTASHGMVLEALGSLDRAEASLEKALARSAKGPQALALHLRLGRVRLEAGQLEAAAASFRRLLELDPANAAAHEGLGRVEAERGRPRQAIEHYRRALELAPQATTLHYPLGQLYGRVGDLEAARRHLAARGDREVLIDDPLLRQIRLLKLNTAFDTVRQFAADAERLSEDTLLGYAIAQFGDVAAAVREFERVLVERESELSPAERARARFVLGALEARADDHAAAIEHYRAALALDPDLAAARVQLGWSLTRLGETEEGFREIAAVLAADPDDTRALLKRAAVLAEGGRRREARADLDRLLALEPANGEALLRLARLDEQEGRAESARQRYRSGLDLAMPAADRALVHFRLGVLARGDEGAAAAAEAFRAAVQLDPEFDEARLHLAASLIAAGEPEAAAVELAELVERRPGDPTAVVALAGALIALGRHGEALGVLEAGHRASHGDPRIAALLARHLAAAPDPRVRDGERALAVVAPLLERQRTLENAETLAMALAAAGRFDSAAERQGELVALARQHGRAGDVRRLQANLDRYRRGEPCCAQP